MKKIIILYPWFRPAYKAGGPIQSLANLTTELVKRGVPTKVIAGNTDHDGTILPVPTGQWVAEGTTGASTYYTTKGDRTIGLLRQLLDKNAIVFTNGIYDTWFNVLPIVLGRKVIVSVRGTLHPGALSQKKFKKNLYLKVWKVLRLHKRCSFHATAPEELTYIKTAFGPNVKITVIPNIPRVLEFHNNVSKKCKTLRLFSVALISPMKNHLLILQSLLQCKSNIEYLIYGPVKDDDYWKLCLKVIEELPSNIKVQYKGDVPPHKLQEVISEGDVAILPSKSENFGHSIFEALSAGKPVIVSHNTPWNDLEAGKAGINVCIDGTTDLVSAIERFANMDETAFSEWSKGARRLAEKSSNQEETVQQYIQLFN